MNELTVIEKKYMPAFEPMLPTYRDLLEPLGIQPARIIRSVLMAVERVPKLQQVPLDSLVNSATSFAVLGIEADGVTGNGFLIPFSMKGSVIAQPIIGYKGFNTLADRGDYAIHGGVVREGDAFEYQLGTDPFVHHRPNEQGNRFDRKVTHAWACPIRADGLKQQPVVLVRDELEEIRSKSAAFKFGGDTPWKDPNIGFEAMCAKSAKRRCNRSIPIIMTGPHQTRQYHLAAAMETRIEEVGKPTQLTPDGGLLIDGKESKLTETQPEPRAELDVTPVKYEIRLNKRVINCTSIQEWRSKFLQAIDAVKPANVPRIAELNEIPMQDLEAEYPDDVAAIRGRLKEKAV